MMRRRSLAALFGLLLLAGCAGQRSRPPPVAVAKPAAAARAQDPQAGRYAQAQDGGPANALDVSKIPEPVPKPEPRARYGNKSPYNVLGQTYTVLPSAQGYTERGIASWYGNKFHGYMTSSFEPYDMYQFSAAHKSLPLPSYARVTNLDNGKSVIVRVNDRGPFHDNRLIDLSFAAAVRLGVWPKGTGLVEVRAIDPAHPTEPTRPPVVEVSSHLPKIYLQIGAYAERDNAERAAAQLRAAAVGEVRIVTASVAAHTVHRVRIGPLPDADAADAITPRIERLGLGAPRVAID